MKEIWKDIEGFEELYEISNLGKVRNIKRNTFLKPKFTNKSNTGAEQVALFKNKKRNVF